MPDRDSETIKRALAVLREAWETRAPAQNVGVALALWCLRGHCPDEWLREFWESVGHDNPYVRSQGMTAALNGIERRLPGGDMSPG